MATLLERQSKIINLPAFDSQDAGQNNICRVRTGKFRYHKFIIDLKNTAAADTALTEAQLKAAVEEMVIKMDEKDVWRVSLTNYLRVQKTVDMNFEVKNGLIVLHFANEAIENELQQKLTSIGTFGVANMTLEIKLTDSIAAPSLKAYAEADHVEQAPGLIRQIRQKTWSITETGTYDKAIQGRNVNYRGVHLIETSAGDISNVQLKYENEFLADCSPKVLEVANLDHGYNVEAGQIYIPFDRGIIPDALPTKLTQNDGIVRDAAMDFALYMENANSVQLLEDFYARPGQ